MAKIRCVVVEVEGTDDAVLSAIRSVVGQLTAQQLTVPVVAPAPIREQLAAPAVEPMRVTERKPRKQPKPSEPSEAAKPLSMTQAVRDALHVMPMSNGDIERHLKGMEYDTDSKRLTVMLCGMRAKGEIYKGDEDLLWRLAEPRGARK